LPIPSLFIVSAIYITLKLSSGYLVGVSGTSRWFTPRSFWHGAS